MTEAAQEDLTGMPTPKQDERTLGPCKALKERTELFRLGEDATGAPCFFWTNPWSGAQEKIANLWWPVHPVEATAEVEALFANLYLHTEADDEATYELGVRDGYEDAVQTIDVETGGDGEFYDSTIPGRGVDVPTMQAGIIERFETLVEQARAALSGSPAPATEGLREALANALRALEFSRAQLNGYALAATGENYNSTTINVAPDAARTALAGVTAPDSNGG